MAELDYTWNNNSPATYGFHSGLYPLGATWSFCAWVITPTNTSIYLYYVGGNPVKTNLLKAVQKNMVNVAEPFSGGTTWIGGDNWDNNRNFDGSIAEVAVFTNALSETNIQSLFLPALGLTSGIGPSFTIPPTNQTLFVGQPLSMTVAGGGIPSPTWSWQGGTNGIAGNWNSSTGVVGNVLDTTGGSSRGVSGSTTATITFSNYNSSFNFDVITSSDSGTNAPYNSYGVLGYPGSGKYWNALSGGLFANTAPSKLDDGVTLSTVNLGATNYNGNWSSGLGDNNLLDQYMNFTTNATSMVFTGVPTGKYNLAIYGVCGTWANRGTTFTVNGLSQSVTNAQAETFRPDNTVIFTNIVVTGGTLEVHMFPSYTPTYPGTNTEGDFNGVQLQLVQYGPGFTGPFTNNTLTWTGGGLYEATNIMGPWITNTHTSPYVVTPTVPQKYFRVYNPTFPPN